MKRKDFFALTGAAGLALPFGKAFGAVPGSEHKHTASGPAEITWKKLRLELFHPWTVSPVWERRGT